MHGSKQLVENLPQQSSFLEILNSLVFSSAEGAYPIVEPAAAGPILSQHGPMDPVYHLQQLEGSHQDIQHAPDQLKA